MKTRWRYICLSLALTSLLLVLMGCSGGSSQRAEQIFVSDAGNNRLLIYNAPLSMGKNAGVVLGQAAFDAQAAPIPPTAQSMNLPLGVALSMLPIAATAVCCNSALLSPLAKRQTLPSARRAGQPI
jgi:hypothetical protein